jgi:GNAT superfamily N-acetyltransferase
MIVRIATDNDVEAACRVLRRSIEALCGADHGGDDEALRSWLANKTPDHLRSWIHAPEQRVLVAEEDDLILGVGAASTAGEITLNYVSPEARFRGVSKAILAALEDFLRENGRDRARLWSTRTAHAFYRQAGYEDDGAPKSWGKLAAQPMTKRL